MQTSKASIKIDPRGKGIHHYEDYLILKHKREVKQFLFEQDFSFPAKRKIYKLYKSKVNRENIGYLYTHPIYEFLVHLIDNSLWALKSYTSVTNIPS